METVFNAPRLTFVLSISAQIFILLAMFSREKLNLIPYNAYVFMCFYLKLLLKFINKAMALQLLCNKIVFKLRVTQCKSPFNRTCKMFLPKKKRKDVASIQVNAAFSLQ